MLPTTMSVSLPRWAATWVAPEVAASEVDRMSLVLGLAMRNVEEQTGGPFAAAVFESGTGRLVSIGLNRVVGEKNSLAHAEVMALGLAHVARGSYDLSTGTDLELVASGQMCAMCLGAVVWSGVRSVVWSTTVGDAIAVGFDEGPTPPDYVAALERRGIRAVAGLMREEGLQVLRRYVSHAGPIYAPHR